MIGENEISISGYSKYNPETKRRRKINPLKEFNSIELGETWGFEYKTVAFVWDKQVHNPGCYTLSQTEFVLAFKKGRFPTPRGARNIRQLILCSSWKA